MAANGGQATGDNGKVQGVCPSDLCVVGVSIIRLIIIGTGTGIISDNGNNRQNIGPRTFAFSIRFGNHCGTFHPFRIGPIRAALALELLPFC